MKYLLMLLLVALVGCDEKDPKHLYKSQLIDWSLLMSTNDTILVNRVEILHDSVFVYRGRSYFTGQYQGQTEFFFPKDRVVYALVNDSIKFIRVDAASPIKVPDTSIAWKTEYIYK